MCERYKPYDYLDVCWKTQQNSTYIHDKNDVNKLDVKECRYEINIYDKLTAHIILQMKR